MIAGPLIRIAGMMVPRRLVIALAIAGAMVLIGVGISSWIANRERAAVAKNEAAIAVTIERTGRRADQQAADWIAARNQAATAQRKVFENATDHISGERLTARQRIDLCLELRDAGTDASQLTQCVDLPAGAEAGARRRDPHQ